jgi:hypothetical protein
MKKEQKIPNYYKCPSKHLNSILVNPKNREQSNQPRYIRNKRNFKELKIITDSESSPGESSDPISSDEEIIFTEKERKKEEKRKEKFELSKIRKPKTPKKNDTIINIPEIKNSVLGNKKFKKKMEAEIIAEKSQEYTNKSMKIESEGKMTSIIQDVLYSVDLIIPNFTSRVPPWGGFFSHKGKQIKVVNTCTVDNYLFAMWVMSHIVPNFLERLPQLEPTNAIKTIINNIETRDWNLARKNWFTKIMKKDIDDEQNQSINFFGEIEVFFLKYIYTYQTHDLLQKCKANCIYNGNLIISDKADILAFAKLKNNKIEIVAPDFSVCNRCQERITCQIKFKKTPLFVFMETRTHFKLNQLPERFDLDNKYYQILCSILYIKQKKHFVSVFFLGGHKYLVDDLKPNQSILLEENNQTHRTFFKYNISSALYYIVD